MGPRIDGAAPTYDDWGSSSSTVETIRPKPGETLEQLAQRLDVDPGALAMANPGVDPKKGLTPFQEIRVPQDLNPQMPAQPVPVSDPPKSSQPAGPIGDTVAGSAMKANLYAAPTGPKREQWLGELARDPAEAHKAWKKLSDADRNAVVSKMTALYGGAFAKDFLEAAKKGKFDGSVATYGSTPDSKFPMITTDQLKARGYKMAGKEATGNAAFDMEVWVNPSGKTIRRDVSTYKFGSGDAAKKPAGTGGPGDVTSTDDADDPDERDKQDKAVTLLGEAQGALQEARELMNQKPVPWDKVNETMMKSWNAQTELDSLMGDPDSSSPNPHPPDMSKVYPKFNEERAAAAQEYQKLYQESEQNDPAAIETRRQIEDANKQVNPSE